MKSDYVYCPRLVPEDYRQLRDRVIDVLPSTYPAWQRLAKEQEARLIQEGYQVEHVIIRADPFFTWCTRTGNSPDKNALLAFATVSADAKQEVA